MVASHRTFKIEVILKGRSNLLISSIYQRHSFRIDFGNNREIWMLRKGPHKTSFAYESVRSHSIVFFTETALQNYWRCKSTLSILFRFTSEVESDETNTKRKGMIYHISSNLRFHWFLKNSFHGMHFRMRNSSPEKQFIFRWDWFSSLETISPFNCEKKWAKWLPHEK